jgi:hypothetical protein
LWSERGPMLHVALSIFHRKEDSQYHPHNLIPGHH